MEDPSLDPSTLSQPQSTNHSSAPTPLPPPYSIGIFISLMLSSHASSGCVRLITSATVILALVELSCSFSAQNAYLSRSCYDNWITPNRLSVKTSICFPSTHIAHHHKASRADTYLAMTSASAKVVASLHNNNNFILSILTALAACGIAMEKNTTIGKAISVGCV